MLPGFRIGFGYDVHQLTIGRKLVLGGITVPSEKGPLAHSDGDVLIHAICDALLGAACLGDIGLHFPDTFPDYKDIDSRILLKRVIQLLKDKGYSVINIDSTVSLQHPKIGIYISEMQKALASAMQIDAEAISIKATTTEKLGFVGRGEGISAHAVALIEKVLQ
jgi:2-C-methyl-D-erythritol 2,4-cyclodiphosphate synthase